MEESQLQLDQERLIKIPERREKRFVFGTLFAVLAVILAFLPFVTTFNEFLTRLVMKVKIYQFIQEFVVPWEARMIVVMLSPFNYKISATPYGLIVNDHLVRISWNCIGWQSLVLLLISFISGLQGSFKVSSKIQCVLFGILGTFLINLIRVAGVVILAMEVSKVASIVFHDYASTLFIIFWLFFFWWFSYRFILVR